MDNDRHEDMDSSKGPRRTTTNKTMIGTSETHWRDRKGRKGGREREREREKDGT